MDTSASSAPTISSAPDAWVVALIERSGFEPREPIGEGAAALAPAELADRLTALGRTDPAIFLERYGSHLSEPELTRFDGAAGDYEVAWHLGQLRRSAATLEQIRRNRRFRAMQELLRAGEFFNDHHMQARAPELYHEYVGRFHDAVVDVVAGRFQASRRARRVRIASRAPHLEPLLRARRRTRSRRATSR